LCENIEDEFDKEGKPTPSAAATPGGGDTGKKGGKK
jgi:hypothetical protein